MAGLQQLKNQLKSVKITAQLTGAMENAASAKFSELNAMLSMYKNYSGKVDEWYACCDFTNAKANLEGSDTAKDCFIVLGYNRGLCGAYNNELLSFADDLLEEKQDSMLFVCGKHAISHFETKIDRTFERIELPDTPKTEDCKQLFARIRDLISDGKIQSLTVIYQKYINTMNQIPTSEKIFPYEQTPEILSDDDVLYLPKQKTVEVDLLKMAIEVLLYKRILEAALGAQAATLIAMHTAVDHANESIVDLENTIHKIRQSVITSDVIETAGAVSPEEELDDGKRE